MDVEMTLHVEHIMDLYSVWLHILDFFHTPGDDDPDDTGNTGDPDGSDQDEDDMYPIFPTRQHCVSWYARLFLRTSQRNEDKPYCT